MFGCFQTAVQHTIINLHSIIDHTLWKVEKAEQAQLTSNLDQDDKRLIIEASFVIHLCLSVD